MTPQGNCEAWAIQGDLTPLMPLLSIGATTHVGSRTTFGLGRFSFEAATESIGEHVSCNDGTGDERCQAPLAAEAGLN